MQIKLKSAIYFCLLASPVILCCVYPTDIPWINDEPLLFLRALELNTAHQIAYRGLTGTVGLPYGPAPLWFYQLMLHLFSLENIALVKIFLCQATTISSLYLIAKKTNNRIWPILIYGFSTYFYFYNRVLWDNPFQIPLAALLILSFCEYSTGANTASSTSKASIEIRNKLSLFIFFLVAALMFQTHLMCLFFIVPTLLVLTLFNYKNLWRDKIFLLISVLASLLITLPYLSVLIHSKVSFSVEASDALPAVKALLFNQLFSPFLFDLNFHPKFFIDSYLLKSILIFTNTIACGLFCFGLGLTVYQIFCKVLAKETNLADCKNSELLIDRLNLVSVTSLLLGFTYFVLFAPKFQAHYLLPFFIPCLIILFNADRYLTKYNSYNLVLAFYITTLGYFTCSFAANIHENSGNKHIHYGPTLKSQIAAVREILGYAKDSEIYFSNYNYRLFPHAFSALYNLYDNENYQEQLPKAKRLTIDFDKSMYSQLSKSNDYAKLIVHKKYDETVSQPSEPEDEKQPEQQSTPQN